jgi:glycosyltransferase 2 family protein
VLTAVFLALAVRNVDLAAVGREVAAADPRYLLPAAVCTMTGYLLRSLRWQIILHPLYRVPYRAVFSVLMLGFATNNILPARLGEVVRAYLLGSRAGVPRSLSLATIVVERVFDGLTLLLLMAVALQVAPVPLENDRLRLVEVASVGIFAGAVVGLVGLLILQKRAVALIGWLARPLPARVAGRLTTMADTFITGLGCLRHPGVVLRAGLCSLLVWGAEAASYAWVAAAFNLGLAPAQQVSAILFLVVFVNLGIMIPSAPGYIGTFQFFARLALTAFAVSAERAVGLAVVSHGMQYVLVTGIGLVLLWRQHLSLGRLVQVAPALEPSQDRPALQATGRPADR